MTDNGYLDLAAEAAGIVRDTDDLRILLEADTGDDNRIVLRRTVMKKAYRAKDRGIVSDTVVVELTATEAVALISDLAVALNRIERSA